MARSKSYWERRQYFLQRLKEENSQGRVDKQILPLLELINSIPDYFTLSSCAGRIVLFAEGEKKYEGEWIFKTHDFANPEEVYNAYINYEGEKPLFLKAEPFIIHIEARTLEKAKELLDLAYSIGLKRSGIFEIRFSDYSDSKEIFIDEKGEEHRFERIVLEILDTPKLEMPVYLEGKHLLGKEEFLKAVEVANQRLKKTRENMKKFYLKIMERFGDYLKRKRL